TATVSHQVAGADYAGVQAGEVVVTVSDNDTATVVLSDAELTIEEGSDSGIYTVVLGSEPVGGEVVVTPGSSDTGVLTVSGALTFSSSNWSSAQTVTLAGVEDVDSADDTATVSHQVSGADYGQVTAAEVEVTVQDRFGIDIEPQSLTVDEEGSDTYTVVLTGSEPVGDVTITPSSDNADVTVGGALTFSPGNWNSAQTVTVNVAKDSDNRDESAVVSHAVAGYRSFSSAASVAVTVQDNDAGARIAPAAALSVNEGGSEIYTVVLQLAPDAEVTVTPGVSGNGSDLSRTPSGALTFSAANWNSEQTVTVAAAEDDDAVDDTATLSHALVSATGNYQSVEAPLDVVVTVSDNDSAGVDIAPLAASVGEGETNTGTYTVALDSEPVGGEVVVTPVSGDQAVATVSGALTFSASNWSTRQTVTVTGVEDANAVDDTATLSHQVSGADYAGVTAGQVVVTVTDNDSAAVTISETALSIDEGDSGLYTVALGSEPAGGDVTVTAQSGAVGVATVSGALTFTDANWNVVQTVTVSGAEDGNAVDDTVTVSHQVSGADYGSVQAAEVIVTVSDNDSVGVEISEALLTVTEGDSDTYTVVLASEPVGGDVTVTPRSGDANVATVGGALTFTSSTWDTEQTVTVNGTEDADAADETVTVSHAVQGGDSDYSTVTEAADVEVTVSDDDSVGVRIEPLAVSVEEGQSGSGETGTYTVVLASAPVGGDVTVTPSSADEQAATVSAALTFTASTWETRQTVILTGVQDSDARDETVTVSHRVAGADYGEVSAAQVQVTVLDDETAGVSVSVATLSVDEGDTGFYTVVLEREPQGGEVVITPGSGDVNVATVSGALTFSATTWNVGQTVTVSGAQDADAVDDTATVSHTVSGANYAGVTAAEVVVTVVDDESAEVSISVATLRVSEDGGTATYTVVLGSEPSGDVTVTPGSGDPLLATVSGALTFSTGDWGTHQTVTVTGVEDANAVADTVTVSHQVVGADYAGVQAPGVEVTVTDSDTAGVSIEPQAVSVNEDGGTATYTVVLGSEPSGDVTVTPGSDAEAVATVSGALTFRASDWDTHQTVTVTGVSDADAATDTATVSHAVVGVEYGSVTAAEVVVTVTDSDTAGVSVSVSSLSIEEGSDTPTYTVVLDSEPSGEVMVTPVSDAQAVATVSGALTFSASNWDTRQTVTVTGVEDANAVADTATVSHQVAGADYAGVQAGEVVVTVSDNDTATVVLSDAELTIEEGSDSGIYTVVLGSEPVGGEVVVTPGSSDTGVLTVSGALTFSSSNWSSAQTVTLAGVEDVDSADDTATVSHQVSGADYGQVTAAEVEVTVQDRFGIDIEPQSLTVDEEGSDTYTVVLTGSEPVGDVTITPSSDNADVTVGGALTFSPGNWNSAQTVTVNVAKDSDNRDESAVVSHAVAGYRSFSSAASVAVTVQDNDAGARIAPAAALSVNEGGSEIYTVVLQLAPDAEVTVTPGVSGNGSDLSRTPSGALTFSAANWNSEQTVTVAAAEDDDAVDDTATLSHALVSATGNYQSVEAPLDVVVTVSDNDSAGVDIAPLAASVGEGETNTGTYTVALDSEPVGGEVVVTPVSGDQAVATVSGALTFSASNWSTRQTVTVTGVEDANAVDDTATLSHQVSGADYAGVTAGQVVVTVTDNDSAAVTISETALSIDEGDSGLYTVALGSEPAGGDVTVTAQSGAVGVATVSGALTFTDANWNVVQTVTVSGAEDGNAVDDTVTVSHQVSGADYGSVQAAEVIVTVSDNDSVGVEISEALLTVTEGDSDTYTVVLASEPVGGDVTVTPRSGDANVATVGGALTFTSSTWDTEQTVTVNGTEDADAADETVTVSHAVQGGDSDYSTVTEAADVEVTVSDDDSVGVRIEPLAVSVEEGQSGSGETGTYTVVLASAPVGGDVTVTPSSADEQAATVSAALTFTASTWETRQTVILTGVQDSDARDETVTVSHRVAGADYGEVSAAQVQVTVLDDETAGV
ncbi:MAG: hypothetical protein OXU61_08235, partial [Gammaproteobacteria bacterium]|nr:hypothetical protein [Gammaproteobacteria bacterium]